MYVPKYWRNKRMRYRLIRVMEGDGIERAKSDAKTRGMTAGSRPVDFKRVKVPS